MPTVLITGASRGLGLEFVKQYAKDEWTILAACRQPGKADALQRLLASTTNVKVEALDINDARSIAALAAKLKNNTLDLLINNAGIFSGIIPSPNAAIGDPAQEFGTLDAEAWDKVLRTNTIAPIMVIEAFVGHLAKSKDAKAINITSRMGSIAEMGQGCIAYRSSKAALNAAMVTIAHELKKQRITTVNLHPGWVQTDMGGAKATLTPETSIAGMKKVIAGLSLKDSGSFYSYDGKTIAW